MRDSRTVVKICQYPTNAFDIKSGISQGDANSAVLFNLI